LTQSTGKAANTIIEVVCYPTCHCDPDEIGGSNLTIVFRDCFGTPCLAMTLRTLYNMGLLRVVRLTYHNRL
jgi:hypothetical protein